MQGHLGENEIRIGETELLGFLVVAMSYELDGSLRNGDGGGGVYIASTQNPTVTHIFEQSRWDQSGQLGETESSNNVNVGVFGGTENTISVCPI